MPQREHFTRRSLPHWYVPGAVHFVTYRLAGTLPKSVLDQLCADRERLLKQKPRTGQSHDQFRAAVHKQLFATYDDHLDRFADCRWLAETRVAAIIRSNLYHHDGSKFRLLSFCVMPNHVHVLFQPVDSLSEIVEPPVGELDDGSSPLSGIMHSLKSYTAHQANKVLGRTGTFWQPESYDHWVRDADELERIVMYITNNPVKAGLVEKPQDWYFCSCHDRFLKDGEPIGILINDW